jgi:hypothetical protein
VLLCEGLHPWRQPQCWQRLQLLLKSRGRLLLCKGLHSRRQPQCWQRLLLLWLWRRLLLPEGLAG